MPKAPSANKNSKRGASGAAGSAPRLCTICDSSPIKYHCPVDRVGYCSVACFKKHKAESCTTKTPASSSITSNPEPPSTSSSSSLVDAAPGTTAAPLPGTDTGGEPHAGSPEDSASRSLHTDVEQPPIRSLAGLLWPPDPEEEGLNALNDPLNRDEPKPLLHSELLAIATSVRLRQLLSTHPFLKDVLNKISRIPNYPPKFPQTVRIKQILGLGEDEGVPNALYYRPIEESGKKASQNQQHDRRNEHSMGLTAGRTFVAEHEREALREFNEVVKAILGEERRKRNSGQAN